MSASEVVGAFCLVFIALWFFWMGMISGEIIGHKKGQIDALTGKVKYELVIQPDSTRVWEKKGK